MNTSKKEDLLLDGLRLALKAGIIFFVYRVLCLLPPIQKVLFQNFRFGPIDLLRVMAFVTMAVTLGLASRQFAKHLEALMPEDFPAASLSNFMVAFLAVLCLYFGFKDLAVFSDGGKLEQTAWFLWGSLAALAFPVIGGGVVFYRHSEDISQAILQQIRKAGESTAGREESSLLLRSAHRG